jgi:hypothetical protein
VLHSGKRVLKKFQISSPSATLGEELKKVDGTAVLNLPRVLPWHSGKPSPSVRFFALREDLFPVNRFPGSSSPSVALGEAFPECCFPECFWLFPECLRHSGKPVAPVVGVRESILTFIKYADIKKENFENETFIQIKLIVVLEKCSIYIPLANIFKTGSEKVAQ